jgi:hypothetical protein
MNLQTVKQFCEGKPWPSEGALRAIILDASWKENDFQSDFIRIGRRVLVDPIEFWKCIEKSRGKK